jgi:hypothetical protein
MKKNKLRWFEHMMRREQIKKVRVVMKINIKGKRGRGRPIKRLLDAIENNKSWCVRRGHKNRDDWRFRIRVADPK